VADAGLAPLDADPGALILLAYTDNNTVDSPQIGHPPDPAKPVTLRTWFVSGRSLLV
jgi:hypothetical protein